MQTPTLSDVGQSTVSVDAETIIAPFLSLGSPKRIADAGLKEFRRLRRQDIGVVFPNPCLAYELTEYASSWRNREPGDPADFDCFVAWHEFYDLARGILDSSAKRYQKATEKGSEGSFSNGSVSGEQVSNIDPEKISEWLLRSERIVGYVWTRVVNRNYYLRHHDREDLKQSLYLGLIEAAPDSIHAKLGLQPSDAFTWTVAKRSGSQWLRRYWRQTRYRSVDTDELDLESLPEDSMEAAEIRTLLGQIPNGEILWRENVCDEPTEPSLAMPKSRAKKALRAELSMFG